MSDDMSKMEIEMKWRDLALQFDGHRMQAFCFLKQILNQLPETEFPEARQFLKEPPLPGEEILRQRLADMVNAGLNAEEYAELYRLREEVKGPDGFATWKDAAIAERMARVSKPIDYLTAMAAFHSVDWHKMSPITGYMNGWNARDDLLKEPK